MFAGLMAATLALAGTVATVNAATIALNGQVTQRPLTPNEISTNGYSLTNAQFSAGISTVALGEPVYLDAMVTASIPPSNIVSVTWSLLTNKPLGSLALLTNSPLGTNVPLFKTADRYNQVRGSGIPTRGPDLFPPGRRRTIHRPGHDHHDGCLERDEHRSGHDEHRHDHHGVHLLWLGILARPATVAAS